MENFTSHPDGAVPAAATIDNAPLTAGSPSQTRQGTVLQGILLLLGSCLPVLGGVLLAPTLPAMAQEFSTVPGVAVLVPLVLTMPALMIAVVAPFAGVVADKVGRRNLLLGALAVYAVVGVLPFFLDSLAGIIAARAVLGICEGFIMTCCTTLIGDYFHEKRRAKYLSLQIVVTTLSATAFFAIGGLLGASGWRNTFWLYAVALILAALMAATLWEPVKSPIRNLRRAVPWRLMIRPVLVTLFGGVVFYTLIVHLSYVLVAQGVHDPGSIGMFSAMAALATAAGAFAFHLFGRLGTRILLPTAFALSAAGMMTIWIASSVAVAMVGAVVASLGTGMLLPTLIIWAVGQLPQAVRGTGTGAWLGSLYIGQFLCPFVVAALGAMVGGLSGGIGILGVLAAVAAVASALAFLKAPKRTESLLGI